MLAGCEGKLVINVVIKRQFDFVEILLHVKELLGKLNTVKSLHGWRAKLGIIVENVPKSHLELHELGRRLLNTYKITLQRETLPCNLVTGKRDI